MDRIVGCYDKTSGDGWVTGMAGRGGGGAHQRLHQVVGIDVV